MPLQALAIAAPAKVNLFLGVHTQLDDRGYHLVDSVMATLGLADVVHVSFSPAISVRCVPEVVGSERNNTCYKAIVALGAALGRTPDLAVVIEKHIPSQAGLGGGSSDAAAAILGACRLWGVDPCGDEAMHAARATGADVPFFLGSACALLRGAGDEPSVSFAPFSGTPVVLVQPKEAGISTRVAYQDFDESPVLAGDLDALLHAIDAHDLDATLPFVSNNLAPVAMRLEPQVATVVAWLSRQSGVRRALVSGSGSCSFAVCESDEVAQGIAAEAQDSGWWSCATQLSGDSLRVIEEW